jgi:hypothetical protein
VTSAILVLIFISKLNCKAPAVCRFALIHSPSARSWSAESDPSFFDKTAGCVEIVRAFGASVSNSTS